MTLQPRLVLEVLGMLLLAGASSAGAAAAAAATCSAGPEAMANHKQLMIPGESDLQQSAGAGVGGRQMEGNLHSCHALLIRCSTPQALAATCLFAGPIEFHEDVLAAVGRAAEA